MDFGSNRETNLKVRQALTVTSDLGADAAKLAEFDGISEHSALSLQMYSQDELMQNSSSLSHTD